MLTANLLFYHIKNLQSTKTAPDKVPIVTSFYHIKNLQSTKTLDDFSHEHLSFITLRIYKVLKHNAPLAVPVKVLSH